MARGKRGPGLEKGGVMDNGTLGIICVTIVSLSLGLFSLARNGSGSKKE